MLEINKSYYAIIPASVRYDNNLKPNAKLLYGEITALTNEKGYCWATNDYFAELYNTSKETVSRWISQLEQNNHIRTSIIYNGQTKHILERRIYIATPIDKNVNTSCQNNQDPIDKNVNTPIDKKVKDNNTVFNNTFNNTHNLDDKTVKTIMAFTENEKLLETIKEFISHRKSIKKPLKTEFTIKLLLKNLNKLGNTDKEKIEILEQSIVNGWQGIFELKKQNNQQEHYYREG
jgi:hypothetical protein